MVGLTETAGLKSEDLASVYPWTRRVAYLLAAAIVGVVIAGFWNFRVVDEFGADIVAANTIGD